MAAHNWRGLRQRAIEKGVLDLMAAPTMHIVLDMMESVGAESATHEAKTQSEAKSELDRYYAKLYRPDPSMLIRKINGTDKAPEPPPGFDDDQVEADFDAFLSGLGGR